MPNQLLNEPFIFTLFIRFLLLCGGVATPELLRMGLNVTLDKVLDSLPASPLMRHVSTVLR